MKVAVLGVNGFVGSAISKSLRKMNYQLIPVTRGDDAEAAIKQADVVIHSANSPRRFVAMKDPVFDFKESVEKTFHFLKMARDHGTHFVLISSISARAQMEHPYGAHRRACEFMALLQKAQVFRLGYMFSREKTYGALDDLLNRRSIYLSRASRYSYSDVEWNAEAIVASLANGGQGIVELGSVGAITLGEIADILGVQGLFVGEYADVQVAEDPPHAAPNILEFVAYLNSIKGV